MFRRIVADRVLFVAACVFLLTVFAVVQVLRGNLVYALPTAFAAVVLGFLDLRPSLAERRRSRDQQSRTGAGTGSAATPHGPAKTERRHSPGARGPSDMETDR